MPFDLVELMYVVWEEDRKDLLIFKCRGCGEIITFNKKKHSIEQVGRRLASHCHTNCKRHLARKTKRK